MNRFVGNLLRFFVYSNIFIAGCAILMVYQASRLLLHTEPGMVLLAFVFFSTLCSYSFHWYLTGQSVISSDRIKWLQDYRYVHTTLFVIGLAGAIFFLFQLLEWWPWLIISAIVTFLYSAPKIPHPYFRALRKVALGKTIFLAFVWMYVTTVLPIVVSGEGWTTASILFVIHRFFLIYAICIVFDYRDRADDKAAGIRSLITYLNEKSITVIFTISLIICSVAVLCLLRYSYSILTITLLLVPAVITALLYDQARKNFSDMFYYFILDGLMALSALLMWIAGI